MGQLGNDLQTAHLGCWRLSAPCHGVRDRLVCVDGQAVCPLEGALARACGKSSLGGQMLGFSADSRARGLCPTPCGQSASMSVCSPPVKPCSKWGQLLFSFPLTLGSGFRSSSF